MAKALATSANPAGAPQRRTDQEHGNENQESGLVEAEEQGHSRQQRALPHQAGHRHRQRRHAEHRQLAAHQRFDEQRRKGRCQ